MTGNMKKVTVIIDNNTGRVTQSFNCQVPNSIKQVVIDSDNLILLRQVTTLQLNQEIKNS